MSQTANTGLEDLVRNRRIIICCGSGGVGKTTTAAALGLHAAALGRQACVVTIDPARRLANSLGVGELTNQPVRIPGPGPGELHAMMLDPKSTFDDLISRYADSNEQAEAIRNNRIYRNLTGTLSGTQEYMAMEKLHELVEEAHFDVIIVDTPPSRNALDFLDAPRRLTHFLDNRLFQAPHDADPGRTPVHERGRPGTPAHHLQGGRGRHRPGRRDLLPGVRRNGEGVQGPGRPGPGTPR